MKARKALDPVLFSRNKIPRCFLLQLGEKVSGVFFYLQDPPYSFPATLKIPSMLLPVLFEDDDYIAINKPSGLLVHKTKIAKDDNPQFALQLLRDQIGQKVYPLHRIDRPTSGVLLFSKSAAAATLFQSQFTAKEIEKSYLAVVRGYMPADHAVIDHPLKKELIGDLQEAKTEYWKLAEVEIPMASSSKYPSSRYSLIRLYPHTGRMHQLRRHMAHSRNYIIGDTTHGQNKQNTFFRENFDMNNLLLHAWQLGFIHPLQHVKIEIAAPLPNHFINIMEAFCWDLNVK